MEYQEKPYDRAFREQISQAIQALIVKRLLILPNDLTPLDTQMANTVEKRADIVVGKKKPKGKKGYEFILHGEIETQNLSQAIVYRMAMYWAMLLNFFKAPVWQFVCYIGPEPMRTPTFLQSFGYAFRFEVIDLKTIPYQTFWEMGTMEGLILSILGDWGKMPKPIIIRKILNKLEKDYQSKKIDEIVLKKALSKLFIFSNLRNLQHEFTQTYQTMAFSLDFVDLSGTPWEAIMEKRITEEVTERVTSKVTEEVTSKVTEEVTSKVTEEVTSKVTEEVTSKVTEEVTSKVTEEVTSKVTEEITRQSVTRALQADKLTMKEIANIFEVPLAFVQKVKQEIAEQ